MSSLELLAALIGAISVYLSVRQNIWSWPTAIVNVVVYAVVFYQAKLYADMGLQVIYAALSIYGWYEWLYGGEIRAASSLVTPVAMAFQNGRRSVRGKTGGRPGDRKAILVQRLEPRLLVFVIAHLVNEVLRRSIESAQYAALAFGQRCQTLGVRPSMGSRGDAYDNAMAESFFATLEVELLAKHRFVSHVEARPEPVNEFETPGGLSLLRNGL